MDFRTNSWYRLLTATSMKSQLSMAGPSSFPNEQGAVIFSPSNNSAPTQQWQIVPVYHSMFMLRTKSSGPNSYLATQAKIGSRPRFSNTTETDESMLWRIVPWGDGTFYFRSVVGGIAYHLDFTDSLGMSTNTTQPQPGQSFSFVKLGEINDSAFSAVHTPASSQSTLQSPSPTAQPSASATVDSVHVETFITTSISSSIAQSPTATTTLLPSLIPASSHSHQLTPATAMGIGATIGAVGLLFVAAICIFICQKFGRRRSTQSLHYRRAKLWRGFSPQPRASHISVWSLKSMGDVYVSELPEVATPSAVLSPLSVRHLSWASWPLDSPPTSPPNPPMSAYPPMSPYAATPRSPPAELSV